LKVLLRKKLFASSRCIAAVSLL